MYTLPLPDTVLRALRGFPHLLLSTIPCSRYVYSGKSGVEKVTTRKCDISRGLKSTNPLGLALSPLGTQIPVIQPRPGPVVAEVRSEYLPGSTVHQ